MRLALQALFCYGSDSPDNDPRQRAKIENELRNNARSAEFLRKIHQVVSAPLRKAPEVFADESFPDANIVAEYLDCQLESTEISDEYERVCGESPEILAEVADCYDILNNRLPQPAAPPKNCRRRLYYIAWEETPASSSASSSAPDKQTSVEEPDVYEAEFIERPSFFKKKKTGSPRSGEPAMKTSSSVDHGKNSRLSDVQIKMRNSAPLKRWLNWSVKGSLAFFIVAGGLNGYSRWRGSLDNMTDEFHPVVAEQEETSPIPVPEPASDYINVNDELASTWGESDRFAVSYVHEPEKTALLQKDRTEATARPMDGGYETPVMGHRGGEGVSLDGRQGLGFPDVNGTPRY